MSKRERIKAHRASERERKEEKRRTSLKMVRALVDELDEEVNEVNPASGECESKYESLYSTDNDREWHDERIELIAQQHAEKINAENEFNFTFEIECCSNKDTNVEHTDLKIWFSRPHCDTDGKLTKEFSVWWGWNEKSMRAKIETMIRKKAREHQESIRRTRKKRFKKRYNGRDKRQIEI